MIISVPIIERFALMSNDGVEFTWAEIASNPMYPTGRKDMPIVNVYNVSKMNNNKNICIGTERPNSFEDVHIKIAKLYKDIFDNDMQKDYYEHTIQTRFKLWILHVEDAWNQKGNLLGHTMLWNSKKWFEFANNIFPEYIEKL